MANQTLHTALDIHSIYKFAIGFEQLFSELQYLEDRFQGSGYPPFNLIKVNETNYAIELAVAGFLEAELDVEVENGELVIRGTNLAESSTSSGEYIHRGIAARDFIKRIKLAEGVKVKTAQVKNGIMTIRLEHVIPTPTKHKVAISFDQ